MSILLKVCREIRWRSEKNMVPNKWSTGNQLRGHIFDNIAQNVCHTADCQNCKKLCESTSFVIFSYYILLKNSSLTFI